MTPDGATTRRTAVTALALLLATGATAAEAGEAAGRIRTASLATLDSQATPEGVGFAALFGDRLAEPCMAMVRLPGDRVSPAHVRSAGMFGIVVAGEMVHHVAGADASDAPRLGAGAFHHIPAGLAHVSAGISEVACVSFLHQDGSFDFLPAGQ